MEYKFTMCLLSGTICLKSSLVYMSLLQCFSKENFVRGFSIVDSHQLGRINCSLLNKDLHQIKTNLVLSKETKKKTNWQIFSSSKFPAIRYIYIVSNLRHNKMIETMKSPQPDIFKSNYFLIHHVLSIDHSLG